MEEKFKNIFIITCLRSISVSVSNRQKKVRTVRSERSWIKEFIDE